jgi:hypothetical protein
MMQEVTERMLKKGSAGVRPQAMEISGKLLMAFNIERIGNQKHVFHAPSPVGSRLEVRGL